MAREEITVAEIIKSKKGDVWIKANKEGINWYKLGVNEGVNVGDTIEVEAELRVTPQNKKYKYIKTLRKLDLDKEKEAKKTQKKANVTLSQAIKAVKKVEDEINKRVIGREEMVRLSILNAISGGVMLSVGGTGIGKTMTAELVSSAFSDKVFYSQFNAFKEFADVIGTLDIKKLREQGITEYKTDRFLNSDFHIYDEFYHAQGKLRAALNDYILRRQLDVDDRGVIKGNTRAIYLTTNKIEDLRDPRVQKEGGLAIGDRIHIVYHVKDPVGEALERILGQADRKYDYRFEKPLASVEHLEKIRAEAKKLKTPQWLIRKISEIDALIRAELPEEYRPSPRKWASLIEMMKVNAVYNGRKLVTKEDLEIVVKNALLMKTEEFEQKLDSILDMPSQRVIDTVESIIKAMNEQTDPAEWRKHIEKEGLDFAEVANAFQNIANEFGQGELEITNNMSPDEIYLKEYMNEISDIFPQMTQFLSEARNVKPEQLNKEIEELTDDVLEREIGKLKNGM